MSDQETLTCYIHPNRETLLRCNRCERPICTSCAIQTPTGYRCPECVRGQQKKFRSARTIDFIFAPVIAGVLSLLGSYVVSLLGFFTLFLAPIVGTIIAEAVKRTTGGRRSKTLFYLVTGATVLGSLPILIMRVLPFLSALLGGRLGIFGVLPLIYQVAYAFLSAGSVYHRLSGIYL